MINCGRRINVVRFVSFTKQKTRLHVELYGWYPMPYGTVHKVLSHGSHIICRVSLLIGMLSEEAQGAQNKVYRQHRLLHTRKISRIATNEDILHVMLAASDPFVNKFRSETKTVASSFDERVLDLLVRSELSDSSAE